MYRLIWNDTRHASYIPYIDVAITASLSIEHPYHDIDFDVFCSRVNLNSSVLSFRLKHAYLCKPSWSLLSFLSAFFADLLASLLCLRLCWYLLSCFFSPDNWFCRFCWNLLKAFPTSGLLSFGSASLTYVITKKDLPPKLSGSCPSPEDFTVLYIIAHKVHHMAINNRHHD